MLYQKVLIAFAFLTIAAKVNAAPIAPSPSKTDDKTTGFIPNSDDKTHGFIPNSDDKTNGFIPKGGSTGSSPDFLQPLMGSINPEQLTQQFGGGKGDSGDMLQSFDPQSLISSFTSGAGGTEPKSTKKPTKPNQEEEGITNNRRQAEESKVGTTPNELVPEPQEFMGQVTKLISNVNPNGLDMNKPTTEN